MKHASGVLVALWALLALTGEGAAPGQGAGREGAVPAAAPAGAQAPPFERTGPRRRVAPPARRLSAAQLAGQRVVFAYEGPRPPRALLRRVAQGRAAGVVLFRRNLGSVGGLRRTLGRLQRATRRSPVQLPLVVMVDQEGGPVRRLPGGPRRSAAAVGAIGSPSAAHRDGRAAGSALRAVGANVDLAPVADVCRPGSALERERRCYGRRVGQVTRLAGAFARGLRSRGVEATLKHFPGFGGARMNTDDAPVRIELPRGRLRNVDERPFATLAPRAPLVMLSTAVYPSLDSRHPAALSRKVAIGELRRQLSFRGVTVSDALDTPAVARHGGPGRLAVLAVRAGTDIVLFGRGYRAGERAARAVADRLRSGALRRRPFERAATRVLRLRSRLAGVSRRRVRSNSGG